MLLGVGKEAEGWGFSVIGSLGKFVDIAAIISSSNDLDLEFVFLVEIRFDDRSLGDAGSSARYARNR